MIITSLGDTVNSFYPARDYPIPAFTPSGQVLIIANGLGVSLFATYTGDLLYSCLSERAEQVPVLSPSGNYWACSFGGYPYHRMNESILVGSTTEPYTTSIIFENHSESWDHTRAIAVSDSGHVICSLTLGVDGLPELIRYLLLNRHGEPAWFSEPLFTSAGSLIPYMNARRAPNDEAVPFPYIDTPLLADVSSDGRRIVYWDYENMVVIDFSDLGESVSD